MPDNQFNVARELRINTMMLEPFKIEDLGRFIPNEYSNPDKVLDQLLDPNFMSVTLRHVDGMTAAILCFTNYSGECWHGFFLISKNFSATQAKVIKRYVHQTMWDMDADRLQTDSEDNAMLNEWHKFLGFTKEGTRKRMLNGKDYNMWAILREEVQ